MRRLSFALLLLGLLGTFAGCRHVAGVCDCQPDSFCGCHRAYGPPRAGVSLDTHGVVTGPVTNAPVTSGPAAPIAMPKGTSPASIGEPKMLPVPQENAPKFN